MEYKRYYSLLLVVTFLLVMFYLFILMTTIIFTPNYLNNTCAADKLCTLKKYSSTSPLTFCMCYYWYTCCNLICNSVYYRTKSLDLLYILNVWNLLPLLDRLFSFTLQVIYTWLVCNIITFVYYFVFLTVFI
jgi:hypothetical protein